MRAIANAALGWASVNIMLHPIPSKHLHFSAIQAHGEVYGKLAFGLAQHLAQIIIKMQEFGRFIELGNRHLIGIQHFNCHRFKPPW
jgi:hypothetical protein